MQSKSILICDPDDTWDNKIVSKLGQQSEYTVKSARNGKEAQRLLYEAPFDVVIIDLNLINFSSIEVIKYIKFSNLKTQIIVTCQNQSLFEDFFPNSKVVQKLGISQSLIKPFQIQKLIDTIEGVKANQSWKNLEGKDAEDFEEEVSDLDDNFTGIKVEEFFCGNVSIFDLFIRLKRNKFLKILHAGDFMEKDRLLKYQKEKGITHLYFKTKERMKYINYMNDLLSKVSANPEVKTDKKLNLLKNASEKFIEEVYVKGISDNLVSEGMDLCDSIYTTINKDKGLASLLKQYCEYNDSAEEHIFLTTFFSTLIANQIPWVTERSMKVIAMGAFFHDIGKIKLPASTRNKKTWEMSPEQYIEYQNHCQYGVELLEGNPIINEQILQIIYQHHELINGDGFPNGLSGSKIYPLAKIISFADFIAEHAVKTGLSPFYTLKDIIEERKDIFNYDPDSVKSMIKGLISSEK